MRINEISFVGVDEKTKQSDLIELARESKAKLEFGFLFSRTKKDRRYPNYKFIQDMSQSLVDYREALADVAETMGNPTNFGISLHLCGESVKDYLNNYADMTSLAELFDRVQLNFALSDKNYDEMMGLIKKKILSFPHNYSPIIIQHNKSKAKFVADLSSKLTKETGTTAHFDILFDGSGGFGRVLENPLEPIEDFYCGYAGGIGPDTVETITRKILKLNANANFYIDMESQIREDNQLSIAKCRSVIQTVNRLINEDEFTDQ